VLDVRGVHRLRPELVGPDRREHAVLVAVGADVHAAHGGVEAVLADVDGHGLRGAGVERDGCRAVELKPGDGDRAIAEMRGAGIAIVESGSIGP